MSTSGSGSVSDRKSISVVAREHHISPQTFNWMLFIQGRMRKSPQEFYAADEYRRYEHVTQKGRGYSYDPGFFKGVDYSASMQDKAEAFKTYYREHCHELKYPLSYEGLKRQMAGVTASDEKEPDDYNWFLVIKKLLSMILK